MGPRVGRAAGLPKSMALGWADPEARALAESGALSAWASRVPAEVTGALPCASRAWSNDVFTDGMAEPTDLTSSGEEEGTACSTAATTARYSPGTARQTA